MMDLLTSFLSGGLSGILGGLLTGVLAYFQERQKHSQRIEMRRLDLEEIRLEAESAEKIAALNLEARTSEADAKVMTASYREASTRWSKGLTLTPAQAWVMVGIDAVRGLMRPGLTAFTVYVMFRIWHEVGAEMLDAAHAFIYIGTTCCLWWFGSRQVEKAMKQ